MATSRNTGYRTGGPVSRGILDRLSSLSRHDIVLAAIPLVFALSLAVYALVAVPLEAAIAIGAVTSLLLLVDALYLNPPVDTGSGGSTR